MKTTFHIISCSAALLVVAACCTKPAQTFEITSPASGEKLLAGDTIAVRWNEAVLDPVVSYNYNLVMDSAWHLFDQVIPVSSEQVKVVLPSSLVFSDSFQIQVEDGSDRTVHAVSAYLPLKLVVLISVPASGQTIHIGDSITLVWRINPQFEAILRDLLFPRDEPHVTPHFIV